MTEQLERYLLETFETALERNYIQPWYQPVVRTISKRVCSMEALARWVDPVRGLIGPDKFVPVLEKHQLIHRLDVHIIFEVCRRLRQTINADETPIPVSVNLSRLDFTLCDIFSVVLEAAKKYQIPHDYLYIEITESVMAEQEDIMHTAVDRFRSAGFQVWMDDFGSGYSSLNVLKDYAFDELKLDMRFLRSFDRRSQRIIASVVQLAKVIEIHTLAEGVETEEQFEYLRNIGCEKAQGFFIGRPQPWEDTLRRVEELGAPPEKPNERKYYDEIGKINLLGALPFLSRDERNRLTSALQLNSIPLALIELGPGGFSILFYNTAFQSATQSSGMCSGLFTQEALRRVLPLSAIPARLVNLMDASCIEGEGRMLFISHEEYYELRAKCVASTADTFCLLMSLNNLSKAADSVKTDRLDEGLRRVYSIFDRVTYIDLKNDSIAPLYTAIREDLLSGRTGIRALVREYAERWIYPDDREDYIAFFDFSTLTERLNADGGSRIYVSQVFRTLTQHGRYVWKEYTLLRLDPAGDACLDLIRSVHDEVLQLQSLAGKPVWTGRGDFTPELLWDNLVRSGPLRLFWKDAERRFVGVNNAFLDYYGFRSEKVLLGKTDEEMGWHIRPDSYMHDEEHILREGAVTRNIPGFCICNGENRDILASKMPIYDDNGEIRGLLGYFLDRELLTANDVRGEETKRRDLLTGLLNSRGISEEAQAFQDEYYLRDMDFARFHVTIDDFSSINRQYGFDFADKAMVRLGAELKEAFGQTAAVGRYDGSRFAILRQVRDLDEARELRNRIREIASRIVEIDGVPVTFYLSVGYSLFSEFEDLDEQKQKTEVRLLANQDEHVSSAYRRQRAEEIFHVYDSLPISFAVYRVLLDEERRVRDAMLFYVNRKFEQSAGRPASELIGSRTREIFPSLGEDWYEKAGRAALNGETVIERFYYAPTGKDYYMTVNQVIHPGYCSFTYQEMDRLDAETKHGAPERGAVSEAD